jgi:hypothetical protein
MEPVRFDDGSVDGGYVQLHEVIGSQGFESDADAVAAAIEARNAATADRWKRFVVVSGSDGRWYVYAGSVVNAEVPPVREGTRVAYVIGFDTAGQPASMFHDGAGWKAQRA